MFGIKCSAWSNRRAILWQILKRFLVGRFRLFLVWFCEEGWKFGFVISFHFAQFSGEH